MIGTATRNTPGAAYGRLPTDQDRARWITVAEQIREDPEILARVRQADPTERLYNTLLDSLRVLAIEARSHQWRDDQVGARPHQLVPGTPGALATVTDWLTWLVTGGRGSGKSRTGGEGVREFLEEREWRTPPYGALVGQTLDSVRIDMVERTLLPILTPGTVRRYNRNSVEIFLRNGGYLRGFSSEAPRKLRGPNFHFAWADELGTWVDRDRSPKALDTTWSNLRLAVRLDDLRTWRPRTIATTTPRPCRLLRNPDPHDVLNPGPGLYDDPRTVVANMSTLDNLANLPQEFLETVIEPLRGTILFDQEVLGLLIEASLGALWTPEEVLAMVRGTDAPETHGGGLARIVVAVDPSVGAGLGDECGIVVAGLGYDGRVYILEDCSRRCPAETWVGIIASAAARWGADAVVAEVNHGFELVGETMGRYRPNLAPIPITAKKGKRLRAEPVKHLAARDRVRFAGGGERFGTLMGQMRTWDGSGDSPDRLDAMVYAVLELLPVETGAGELVSVASGLARR